MLAAIHRGHLAAAVTGTTGAARLGSSKGVLATVRARGSTWSTHAPGALQCTTRPASTCARCRGPTTGPGTGRLPVHGHHCAAAASAPRFVAAVPTLAAAAMSTATTTTPARTPAQPLPPPALGREFFAGGTIDRLGDGTRHASHILEEALAADDTLVQPFYKLMPLVASRPTTKPDGSPGRPAMAPAWVKAREFLPRLDLFLSPEALPRNGRGAGTASESASGGTAAAPAGRACPDGAHVIHDYAVLGRDAEGRLRLAVNVTEAADAIAAAAAASGGAAVDATDLSSTSSNPVAAAAAPHLVDVGTAIKSTAGAGAASSASSSSAAASSDPSASPASSDASDAAELSWMDLRSMMMGMHRLDAAEASHVGHGRALLQWHRQARFCGKCGSRTAVMEGGMKRRCSDPACNLCVYPRTDPIVIALVHKREYVGGGGGGGSSSGGGTAAAMTPASSAAEPSSPVCLLGRSAGFPPGMFSCLAGFLEPGESIEEAVRREVKEETDVDVVAVRYVASQPWPLARGAFGQIMIGCLAEAAPASTITVNESELAEARWFGPAEVTTALALGGRPPRSSPGGAVGEAEQPALWVPGRWAIAHTLINAWATETASKM